MGMLTCILTEHDCFKAGRTIVPKGVMIHSTGANNPNLRRYVQPVGEGEELGKSLGKNPNGNHWNRPGLKSCVHAFIGKLADGSVATVQTLPWDHRGWHAGGSANNTHISFEICEDGLKDKNYFETIYDKAVELTAFLCEEYDLDPRADGVVICHKEGCRRGIASNHGDVEHWFPKFGKTMDNFRSDVERAMKGEEQVTQEQFNAMMDQWLISRSEEGPSNWSEKERAWMEQMGLIRGDGSGKMRYKDFCTREELAVMIYRLEHPGE